MECPKVNSCCGCCDLKSGTITIGILSLISSALMIGLLYSVDMSDEDLEGLRTLRTITTVIASIVIVIAVILLIGVVKSVPMLILPWIIVYGLSIIYNIANSIFTLVQELSSSTSGSAVGTFVGSIIGILISIYLWLVVFSYFRQLRSDLRNGVTNHSNQQHTPYQP